MVATKLDPKTSLCCVCVFLGGVFRWCIDVQWCGVCQEGELLLLMAAWGLKWASSDSTAPYTGWGRGTLLGRHSVWGLLQSQTVTVRAVCHHLDHTPLYSNIAWNCIVWIKWCVTRKYDWMKEVMWLYLVNKTAKQKRIKRYIIHSQVILQIQYNIIHVLLPNRKNCAQK